MWRAAGVYKARAPVCWVPWPSLRMETAERTESPAVQCVRGRSRLLPASPEGRMLSRRADSGYRTSAPPCASPAPSLPPAPPQLLLPALRSRHPPSPSSAAVCSKGSAFTSPLRTLCSPPRRSAGFWRPWVEDQGEKEEEAPHHTSEAVSEQRVSGRASQGVVDRPGRGTPAPGRQCPACPSLKIASAGGHTAGPVGAHAAGASSRTSGTQGEGPEQSYSY